MTITDKLLTAEEFFHLPDGDFPLELIDGRVVELTPPGGAHGMSTHAVARLIGNHVAERRLGYVLVGDPGIVLARNPDRVRGPDVCYFAATRLPGGPPEGFIEVAPDFVVEIISPRTTRSEVRQKTDEWLGAGVRLVWNVYRRTRSVSAETLGATTVYHEHDVITGAPVLPDFRVAVSALFAT